MIKLRRHARVQWIAVAPDRSRMCRPAQTIKKAMLIRMKRKCARHSPTHALSKMAEQALCLEMTSPREEGRCRVDKATRINKVLYLKEKTSPNSGNKFCRASLDGARKDLALA